MKERIALSKSVDVGNDLSATAFRPNYIYLFEDGVQVYFDPANIPALRLAYPIKGAEDTFGQVVMPEKVAQAFKAALSDVLDLCRVRMETPFVPEVKEETPIDVTPAPGPGPVRGAADAERPVA